MERIFTCNKQSCEFLTGKDLMVHTTMFFSGTYLAVPVLVLNLGESASLGTGTLTSTLFATDCFLNCPFAYIKNKELLL